MLPRPTAYPPASRSVRPLLTAAIWTVTLGCVLVAGGLAALFATMPASLDIGELVTAGVEPWRDAGLAMVAFAGLLGAAALSLWLWHGRRFAGPVARGLAWTIAAAEVALVAAGVVMVARDWF